MIAHDCVLVRCVRACFTRWFLFSRHGGNEREENDDLDILILKSSCWPTCHRQRITSRQRCVCSYRVFCLLGDGELSEGSVWEAMAFASYYQLDNLVAILDINRLGQSEPAPLQHHVEKYQRRCEAFG